MKVSAETAARAYADLRKAGFPSTPPQTKEELEGFLRVAPRSVSEAAKTVREFLQGNDYGKLQTAVSERNARLGIVSTGSTAATATTGTARSGSMGASGKDVGKLLRQSGSTSAREFSSIAKTYNDDLNQVQQQLQKAVADNAASIGTVTGQLNDAAKTAADTMIKGGKPYAALILKITGVAPTEIAATVQKLYDNAEALAAYRQLANLGYDGKNYARSWYQFGAKNADAALAATVLNATGASSFAALLADVAAANNMVGLSEKIAKQLITADLKAIAGAAAPEVADLLRDVAAAKAQITFLKRLRDEKLQPALAEIQTERADVTTTAARLTKGNGTLKASPQEIIAHYNERKIQAARTLQQARAVQTRIIQSPPQVYNQVTYVNNGPSMFETWFWWNFWFGGQPSVVNNYYVTNPPLVVDPSVIAPYGGAPVISADPNAGVIVDPNAQPLNPDAYFTPAPALNDPTTTTPDASVPDTWVDTSTTTFGTGVAGDANARGGFQTIQNLDPTAGYGRATDPFQQPDPAPASQQQSFGQQQSYDNGQSSQVDQGGSTGSWDSTNNDAAAASNNTYTPSTSTNQSTFDSRSDSLGSS